MKMLSTGKFKLRADFSPSGDQPEAIATLVKGLREGLPYQTLLGVTGSGKTYTKMCIRDRGGGLPRDMGIAFIRRLVYTRIFIAVLILALPTLSSRRILER